MIAIVKPKPEDAEGIQTVFRDSWLETYPNAEVGITEDDMKEVFRHAFKREAIEKRRRDIQEEESPNHLFLIAKDGERVVGVCRAYVRDVYNQLQAMYILPSYQGQGIGQQLWKACVEFFDAKKDTVVDVATYNTKAIAFYTKCGFVDSGERITEERHQMPISKVIIPEMRMVISAIQK